MHTQDTTNELSYGYCACGCGKLAPIAKRTDPRKNAVKGEPRRYCVGHAMRGRRTLSVSERFWAKADKRGPADCWEWTAAKTKAGYGQLAIENVRIYAHRISYELHFGPVPDSLHVLHHCDNPGCVNPKHLFVGTDVDNVADMCAKGRARGSIRKITEVDALEIFALRNQSIPLSILAHRYGVSPQSICDIQHGRTWAYITSILP